MRAWRISGSGRGSGQLEVFVSLALFGIFLAVFLDRTFYYQEYGEKSAMEMTVANMRTGLRYKIADLIMNNRLSEIPTLADENPVNWLENPPQNYLGEFDSTPAMDPAGKWYFDRSTRQLVYTVNNRRHFVPSNGEDFTVRYQALRLEPKAATVPNGRAPQAWVGLRQVQEYAWLQ